MPARCIRALAAWVAVALLSVAAAPEVAAQSGYQIRAGDTLAIEVLEDSGLNRSTLVLPDGTISFPLVGTVQARGRTVADLQRVLASGLAVNFAVEPNVFVSVATLAERRARGPAKPRTIDAYIMGEIAAPGKKEIKPGTTLLQFLAEAGGLTKFAADRRIELHRTDPKTGTVSIYLFSYRAGDGGTRISGGTVLAPGDVVVVPQRRLFE